MKFDKHGLDEFHYHEAIDRLWMLMETFSDHIEEHPVIQAHPHLKFKAEEALGQMMRLYQAIGRTEYDTFDVKENPCSEVLPTNRAVDSPIELK